MEPETVIYLISFGICGALGLWFVVGQLNQKRENLAAAKASTPLIDGGTYIAGHPGLARPVSVQFTSNGTDLLLVQPGDAAPLAQIPIGSVKSLDLIDKTKVTTDSRYTLTRVALLGILALAAPKTTTQTHSSFLLALKWKHSEAEITAYFRFDGPTAETSASRAVAFVAGLMSPG